MMLLNKTYNCYYDEDFDDLTIRKKDSHSVYSDEIYSNIFIYRESESDKVVGAQILCYKNRAQEVLKQYLPKRIYNMLKGINKQIDIN